MRINTCDICGKKIENSKKIVIGYQTSWPNVDICLSCAKPVVSFLTKNKLVKNEKKS